MKLIKVAEIKYNDQTFRDDICDFLNSKGYAWAFSNQNRVLDIFKSTKPIPTDEELSCMVDEYLNKISNVEYVTINDNFDLIVNGDDRCCPHCNAKYSKGTNVNEFVRYISPDDKMIIYCKHCHKPIVLKNKDASHL